MSGMLTPPAAARRFAIVIEFPVAQSAPPQPTVVAYNPRFLILPSVKVPHLASQIQVPMARLVPSKRICRDTFRLPSEFLQQCRRKMAVQVQLVDLAAPSILEFLNHLEHTCHNSVRNARLKRALRTPQPPFEPSEIDLPFPCLRALHLPSARRPRHLQQRRP